MKVLLVTAYFPPDTGSAAHLFYELGVQLVRQNHAVTVLTSFPSYHAVEPVNGYKGKRFLRERIDGMDIVRIRVPNLPRHIPAARAVWQFALAHRFARAIRRIEKHDVALIYSPPLPLGLAGASLKSSNTPFILNVQDLFPQSAVDLKILKNRWLIAFFEALEKRIYRAADHITVHSPGNLAHVVRTGIDADNVTVVPNWVDTDFLQPDRRRNGFSEKHGLAGRFVVSFAGVLGYSQDIDVILEAAHLLRDGQEILFLVVGDGVEKDRLVRKANVMGCTNVLFLPMQSRQVYPEVLTASDVCLVTLNKEVVSPVVPSKILSIMAAGKPLVACMNPQGDAAHVVRTARCGFVLPAGDAAGLAEAIVKLRHDPRLRTELGGNGRAYCVENFSLEKCARRYVGLFTEMKQNG
jgi:glycosyltransferase involved in cell wall biosynthesis